MLPISFEDFIKEIEQFEPLSSISFELKSLSDKHLAISSTCLVIYCFKYKNWYYQPLGCSQGVGNTLKEAYEATLDKNMTPEEFELEVNKFSDQYLLGKKFLFGNNTIKYKQIPYTCSLGDIGITYVEGFQKPWEFLLSKELLDTYNRFTYISGSGSTLVEAYLDVFGVYL